MVLDGQRAKVVDYLVCIHSQSRLPASRLTVHSLTADIFALVDILRGLRMHSCTAWAHEQSSKAASQHSVLLLTPKT